MTLFQDIHGDDHDRTQTALRRLVALYDTWHKPEEALKYRARLDEPAP